MDHLIDPVACFNIACDAPFLRLAAKLPAAAEDMGTRSRGQHTVLGAQRSKAQIVLVFLGIALASERKIKPPSFFFFYFSGERFCFSVNIIITIREVALCGYC